MSTYKALVGKKIKSVSSDPSDSADGQMWYNTTTQSLRGLAVLEAWATASPLIVGRNAMATSDGSTTAAFAAGGNPDSTEEWNGSGFSTGGALTTSRRYLSGCGTLTAGLTFGGNKAPLPTLAGDTEEYNGTSFSEQNDLNTARQFLGRAGTQTAGLAFAGTAGPGASAATEEYNGTSWSEQNDMSTARSYLSGCGTQTAGLVAGGTSNSTATEQYDGTSWTTGGTLNTGATNRSMSGLQTAALCYGGKTGPSTFITNTENYNGTSWTNLAPVALATGRNFAGGIGNADTSALAIGGGSGPGQTTDNEEFTRSTNVITAAAWASGTALPSARFNGASAGTTTAGIIAGGELSPGTRTGETLYFDGSSWTAQPATLSPAPNADGVKMAGTQTAGILNSFRGGGSPGPAYTDARSWNGSTWTSIPSTSSNHSFSNLFRNGTPSAATTIGGNNEVGGIQSAVEEYNGSSWGSETSLPAGRSEMAAFGTPSAGVIAGGSLGPGTPNRTATALEYNGSSWTTTGSITAAATTVGGGGTETTGIIFGGYNPSPAATGNTNTYDGTSFSTAPTMATARGGLYSIGSSSGAYAAGGNPPVSTTVEEFTPETTAANIKTFSSS